jgi:hypothetical protein
MGCTIPGVAVSRDEVEPLLLTYAWHRWVILCLDKDVLLVD